MNQDALLYRGYKLLALNEPTITVVPSESITHVGDLD